MSILESLLLLLLLLLLLYCCVGCVLLRDCWLPELRVKNEDCCSQHEGALEKISGGFFAFRCSLLSLSLFEANFFLGGSDFLRCTLMPFGKIGPTVVSCDSDTQKIEGYVDRITNK